MQASPTLLASVMIAKKLGSKNTLPTDAAAATENKMKSKVAHVLIKT
jgi:hypothetical protein